MRTTDDSRVGDRSRSPLCPSPGSFRAETVVYGTLGLAGMLAIFIALVSASMPPGGRKDPWTDTVRYVRSGQWLADVRSAGAIFRFLVEPEPTNANHAPQVG
jgi:hypothetical protein